MFHRYNYEAEYYSALTRVPLDVRRKLDLAGVKIALKEWLSFSLEERAVLCHLPYETSEEREVYGRYLGFLCRHYFGKPEDRVAALSDAHWGPEQLPRAVADKSSALGGEVTLDQWRVLSGPQRYALYKTATSTSQPEAFEQVLQQLQDLLPGRQ
jgi:hypothetical protein